MTKEEFEKYLENFWSWTSSQERKPESWLYSLEAWCQKIYEKEKNKDNSEAKPST